MPDEPLSSPTLRRLFQARNEWDRLYQLSNLLKEASIDLPDFFDSSVVWSSICREEDPERLAWKLARELRKRAEGRVPECLQPYLERPDLAEEERREDLRHLHTALRQWLDSESREPGSAAPKRSLKVIWRIDRQGDPLRAKVTIDVLANSAKLREGARNFFQVRGMCHEAAHRPDMFTPEDSALLRWLADYLPILCTDKNRHGSPFLTDNRSLLIWLQAWDSTGRCRFEDGDEVGYNPLPARIVPRIEAESTGNGGGNGCSRPAAVAMEFDVVTAEGQRIPLAEAAVFLSDKPESSKFELELACLKGTFYRLIERPPVSILQLSLKHGRTCFEGAAARELLPPLLRKFPSLQSQVRLHLRQVPSQVLFYFTLDEDDLLRIRLVAQPRQGTRSWEWSHHGWHRQAGLPHGNAKGEDAVAAMPPPPDISPPSPPGASEVIEPSREIWDEVPAEADTVAALEWLRRWEGEPGEMCGHPDEPGWWVPVQGRKLPEMIALWGERAPHWQYFGNRRFEQLLAGRKHAFPKIKITSTGVDWFAIRAEWESESEKLSPEDWHKLRTSDDAYIKLGNGAWVAREDMEQVVGVVQAMAELGLSSDGEEHRVSLLELAGGRSEAWLKIVSANALGGDLQRLREAVEQFAGIPSVPVPNGLQASLRPYQQEGLHFLAYASRLGLGAVLADDMGLGKTVQALSWLEHLRDTEGPAPSLVVCPASVVFNWQREATQFTPRQRVLCLTAGDARHALRDAIPKHDLIITNYALLRRDLAALRKFSFRALVLDEAQNIKNPDSMVARAAKSLQARHRLALTGTPLENRLLDLWSIVDFASPGYLANRSKFLEQYDRGAPPQARTLLSSRLRPILLRRLKKQVAQDLPERIEERIDCELTPGQRKFYLAELLRARQSLRESDPASGGAGRLHVLAALTRLRQICCHPVLAGGKGNLGSGKTTTLFETLESLYAEGHKVLVFSQFVEMLKVLQAELETRGWPFYLLTGQTSNRGEVVESFQNDPRPAIFLLSLKAAGTGLNLTSASYVILHDPWWNPAVEAQAIDRTHRIGQHRTVMAYRLVTRDTVEEKIWQLQQSKSRLIADVLGEQGFNGSLTREDLEYLLAPPDDLHADADDAT